MLTQILLQKLSFNSKLFYFYLLFFYYYLKYILFPKNFYLLIEVFVVNALYLRLLSLFHRLTALNFLGWWISFEDRRTRTREQRIAAIFHKFLSKWRRIFISKLISIESFPYLVYMHICITLYESFSFNSDPKVVFICKSDNFQPRSILHFKKISLSQYCVDYLFLGNLWTLSVKLQNLHMQISYWGIESGQEKKTFFFDWGFVQLMKKA